MSKNAQLTEFPDGAVPSAYDYNTFSSRLLAVLEPRSNPKAAVKLLASVVGIKRKDAHDMAYSMLLPKPSTLRKIAAYIKKPESYLTKGTILEKYAHLALVKTQSPVAEKPKSKVIHLVENAKPICMKMDLPSEIESLCQNAINAIDLARIKLAEANKILDDAESALKIRLSRAIAPRHKSWDSIKKSNLHS